jgi:hypothetical protein
MCSRCWPLCERGANQGHGSYHDPGVKLPQVAYSFKTLARTADINALSRMSAGQIFGGCIPPTMELQSLFAAGLGASQALQHTQQK